MGFITHSIQPYSYKASYILSKNSQSLRLNGYSFCAILCWFHPSTSGTVIYSSSGIRITPESIQSDKNSFTKVLKVSVYRVKKIRIPLGNSTLFLTLGFNKVTPRVISRSFGKGEGDSLKGIISAYVKISVGSVLSEINFNILEIILSSKVASTHSVTRDKVNSLPTTGITK